MKNEKILCSKLLLVLLLLCTIFFSAKKIIKAREWNSIDIAVDEDFFNANLFTSSSVRKSIDYIWTCTYDRLLNLEEYGELSYSLAENITILPNPNAVHLPILGNIINGISSIPSGTIIPGCVGYSTDIFDAELNNDSFNNYIGECILEIKLRSGINYHNGETFDANTLYNFIQQAKSVPGTLIYEQWKPITNQVVIDSDTIIWTLNFSGLNYGFMDFKYSLTMPVASIGYFENNDINNYIGTGAYFVEDVSQENIISLLKNRTWWNNTESQSNIDLINFIYTSINESNYFNYDICVISSENEEYDCIQGVNNYYISNNPIIMRYNPNSPYINSNIINILNFQQLSCFGINLDSQASFSRLLNETSDYWCYENKMNNTLPALNEIELHNYFDGLSILTKENSYLSNMADSLSLIFYDGINEINVISEEERMYEEMLRHGEYDVALQEVELEKIDSSITYLTGWMMNNSNLLIALKHVNNPLAFQILQIKIQLSILNENFINNLGWTNKKVIFNTNNISNFNAPSFYAPYGNAARIDFRTLIVNDNR